MACFGYDIEVLLRGIQVTLVLTTVLSSIIVVMTLGKCAHRSPTGFRERHVCIGLMKSKNFVWLMETPFYTVEPQ
jgi:hypothetical protein